MSINRKTLFDSFSENDSKQEDGDDTDSKLHTDYNAEMKIINESIRKLRTTIVQDNIDPENLILGRFLTLNEVNHGPGDKSQDEGIDRMKTTNIASLEGRLGLLLCFSPIFFIITLLS